MKFFTIVFLVFGCHLSMVLCNNCQIKKSLSGTISHSGSISYYEKCWMIPAIAGKFIRIHIDDISSQLSCTNAFVKLSVPEATEEYKFCPAYSNKNPIVSLGSVIVRPYVNHHYGKPLSFSLSFIIKDIECNNKGSFHCNNNTCVPGSKVCDGVKDCSNGADEVGCETGILAVKGIEEARQNTISWLKKKRSTSWGWRDYTSRAVVVLYLASGANFNGTILEEELMAKQTELKNCSSPAEIIHNK
ncbi:CUB domain-containing protein [Caerostris extrusa]|uniref:CUB domain-containing protein n=1 Tax=Caerostris extrusa TaxID=172846 RepID=A0AAV4SCY1_CAEEX|nr:CUB domain-containing protein [Caerostris extrusa]